MTRINTIPVPELTGPHLIAEYRELPRAMRRAVLATYRGKQPSDIAIAAEFKLGKGHELFFIDKCAWLYDRWQALRAEMIQRGYSPGAEFGLIVTGRARYLRRHGKQFYGQYVPTPEAQALSRARIAERLAA